MKMDNKVSKVILEHIDKSDYEESMKSFLKEILNFELEFQIIYEENDSQGTHHFSNEYMSLIQENVGD